MQNLQIDAQRLWDSLMETAQIGATPKAGLCRLTLTDLDRQVRDWFKAQCEALGCTVTVDDMGNMFARRPGKNPALPPIAMGSHLDTQPTGGKFDGVLGVLAALEAHAHAARGGLRDQRTDRDRQLDQRRRRALCPGDAGLGRLCRRVLARLRLCADGPRRQNLWRGIGAHRLSRRGEGRRAQIRRHVRIAHRARPDPRGRSPHDRHRARRPGHALVRGHGDWPGSPHRRDADDAAQECAPRRRAHDRAHRRYRARARTLRRRHRRPDREPAEQPQCHSRRSVLHHRFPPSGRHKCSTPWRRSCAPRSPRFCRRWA